MNTETSSIWKKAFNNGLISGSLCLLVMLVGLVEAFGDTYIISGIITLGDIISDDSGHRTNLYDVKKCLK